MHIDDLKPETLDALAKALQAVQTEILQKSGGIAVMLEIRSGSTAHGGGGMAIGIQVIGCREHDRRGGEDRPVYGPAADPVTELLRRLRPRSPEEN